MFLIVSLLLQAISVPSCVSTINVNPVDWCCGDYRQNCVAFFHSGRMFPARRTSKGVMALFLMSIRMVMIMSEFEAKTILIVDDDSEVCKLLEVLLKSQDRIVHTAASVADAREKLRKEKVDLIILDLYLPDGNGIDLLAGMRASSETPDVPSTIIMTAFGSWETHVKAHHLGAYYYLDKPFKLTQVRLLVEQALREKTIQ